MLSPKGVAVNRSNFSGRKDRGRIFDRIAGIEWNAVEFDRKVFVAETLEKDAELLYLFKKKQIIWYSRRNINNEIKIKISGTFELLEKLEAMPNMVSIKCWTFFVK